MKHGETIQEALDRSQTDRRSFLEFCGGLMVAAPCGLNLTRSRSVEAIAALLGPAPRPSVIWLHFQDCTGCSETLLRAARPDLATLVFDVLSIDYHETLMAASGKQAEAALAQALEQNRGKYVLVCEGAIPTADGGKYLKLGGRPGLEVLAEAASGAAAIVCMGSCSSWGGVASAPPNPTGATGVDSLVHDRPIVNLPGCPPNPYTLLAVVLEYVTCGKLPALDAHKRPLFAYDRTIHEHCPRRAHFDAGEFARSFGDEGHRRGWCLCALGCKGPVTHAACSTRHFNDVVDCWPIGIGAPCAGCTESEVAFRVPLFQTVKPEQVTPPSTYAPVFTAQGSSSTTAAALAGLAGGALIGAGIVASRKLQGEKDGGAGKEG